MTTGASNNPLRERPFGPVEVNVRSKAKISRNDPRSRPASAKFSLSGLRPLRMLRGAGPTLEATRPQAPWYPLLCGKPPCQRGMASHSSHVRIFIASQAKRGILPASWALPGLPGGS